LPERAAIVTGASRGIGYAIADVLGEEGYALTLTARTPESLEKATEELRGKGHQVECVAGNMADETAVKAAVDRHRERFGRLDVLVNNAGVGIGAPAGEQQTKHVDLQINVNLRAIVLFYREAAALLRAAAADADRALVVNLASFAGKSGQPWLSVYSATKAGVIAFTQAMNKEMAGDGVKSTAFCPGLVDTDMAGFIKTQISAEDMLRPQDIAEAMRFLLRVSPACVIPEVVFQRSADFQLNL
jgi:short-subunit dehydrogenase